MSDVADSSVDAVVSISALEHSSPHGLRDCVVELMRVLRLEGRLIAILGAGCNLEAIPSTPVPEGRDVYRSVGWLWYSTTE